MQRRWKELTKEEEKKEEQGDEHRAEKLIPSLAISIFGSGGLTLLLVVSGLFTEGAEDVLVFLFLGFPFAIVACVWLFSTIFISTKLVEPSSQPRLLVENLVEVLSFLAVFVSGMICMYRVFGSMSWWWFITLAMLGGLSAISHGWFLYLQRTRNSIDLAWRDLDPYERKDSEIFVTGLELEHNFFQTYFQLFISATILFITAGVAAYFFRSTQISSVTLLNTVLMVTWLVIGIFFGILLPISKHMEYIRRIVRDIAIGKFGKQ